MWLKLSKPVFNTADAPTEQTPTPAPTEAVEATPAPVAIEAPVALEAPPTTVAAKPWYLEELAAARARARAAEEGRAAAEALAQRLQQQRSAPDNNPASQPQPQPVNTQTAEQAAHQIIMKERRNDIIRAGYATFGGAKFDEIGNTLAAVGATTDDFVQDVLAVDAANAHKLFADLAADPQQANRLAGLPSRQRIAELVKMNLKAQTAPSSETPAPQPGPSPAPAPAAKTVSKVPAPAPVIVPSAVKPTPDWRSDEASEEEFTRGFNETWSKRRAVR